MSVEFEENNSIENPVPEYKSRVVFGKPEIPQMAQWFMKHGIIKSERHAGYFLLVIVILSIAVSLFLIFFNPFVAQQKIPEGYKVINTPQGLPRIAPVN